MNVQDYEDFIQFRAMRKHQGKRQQEHQIKADYFRKYFGDSRCGKPDAMHHLSYFESMDIKSEYVNKFKRFIEDIGEFKLSQRLVMALLFCGVTKREIMALIGCRNERLNEIINGKRNILYGEI